jgi:hypothetical protein
MMPHEDEIEKFVTNCETGGDCETCGGVGVIPTNGKEHKICPICEGCGMKLSSLQVRQDSTNAKS